MSRSRSALPRAHASDVVKCSNIRELSILDIDSSYKKLSIGEIFPTWYSGTLHHLVVIGLATEPLLVGCSLLLACLPLTCDLIQSSRNMMFSFVLLLLIMAEN